MANDKLTTAKKNKNDEFYTRLSDIEKECYHYREHFKNKIVYCNCDDPEKSRFFNYFKLNFDKLELKKLIATCYNENGFGKVCEYTGSDVIVRELIGNGDFRSNECVSYLDECDIVVTNCPFSLFRSFLLLIVEHNKDFLLIGNMNALTYKEIFPLIKQNRLWLGVSNFNQGMYFTVPDDYEYAETYKFKKEIDGVRVMRVPGICWFTNMDHSKRQTELELLKKYSPDEFPKYDNYDAIEVSKVCNIPMDYRGLMGVPLTFVDKYCPTQFEIIGHEHDLDGSGYGEHISQFMVNDKGIYSRILIKHKHLIK